MCAPFATDDSWEGRDLLRVCAGRVECSFTHTKKIDKKKTQLKTN